MVRILTVAAVLFALGGSGWVTGAAGGTIDPGQERTVEGTVSAVDVSHRAVVVEVPMGGKSLTVGVTLADSVSPRVGGQTTSLSNVDVGDRARLHYTRRNGSLVGLDLQVLR